MNELKILKIGWENENPLMPMVLLNKKQRQDMGVVEKDLIRVVQKLKVAGQDVEKMVLAMVLKQYKQFASEQSGCLINNILATRLEVSQEDTIEIRKDITESEHNRFMQDITQQGLFGF